MNPQDTQVTEHAIKCFVRFLRDATRAAEALDAPITQEKYAWARMRLGELMQTASYRSTDAQGRELWRSPPSAYGLRWLLAYENDRKVRKVIWVGASRPPKAMWSEPR